MSIPKSVIHECLRVVDPKRLKKLARENFTRMHGPYTHEDYVERCGTESRAPSIFVGLPLEDLINVGRVLSLDLNGKTEDEALERVLLYFGNYRELKAGLKSERPVYDALISGAIPSKVRQAVIVKRELAGESSITDGDQAAWHLLKFVELLHLKSTDAGHTFAYLSDGWPEPISRFLIMVDCSEMAARLNEWYDKYFAGLTGEKLIDKCHSMSMDELDDPKHRKEWRTAWEGCGAELDQKTRSFLLAHPEMF